MNLRGKLYALMVHHGYSLHDDNDYHYSIQEVDGKLRMFTYNLRKPPYNGFSEGFNQSKLRGIIDAYVDKIVLYGNLRKIEDIEEAYEEKVRELDVENAF